MTRESPHADGLDGLRIAGLDALLRQGSSRRLPPVERWSPPYCGDIGLAIRADGTWMYGDSPIGRDRLVRLFASILIREPDGQHYLVTPVEKILVRVEDAPFLGVEMEVRGDGRQQEIIVRTGLDDVVTCGPGHRLRFAAGSSGGPFKPYVHVRRGLDARLTRPLAFDLAALLAPNGDAVAGAMGVWSGGEWFPLPAD
ncbi:MAG: DUF1285 domain-containing protein [Hyphomicrobiaceae bacterium]|nr:DUF1285 domain-containing protein [Hyphomicrobiaceae bacterium]